MSVRSAAAAAAAADVVHSRSSSSSDAHRSRHVNSGSSPDVAPLGNVIIATANLLATQFVTRHVLARAASLSS